MNRRHLEDTKVALVGRREKLIGRFGDAARARKDMRHIAADLRMTNEFLESLEQIENENGSGAAGGSRRYAVSSLFLDECFRKLTADANEQFFFVTGAEIDGVLVLDQCAEVTHQSRSRTGVVASMPSTHNALIRLEQFGHRFLAHFHSHPGNGPGATHPSGIDRNFQARLERAGHLAVMAIFSRDGFIRFIRLDNPAVDIEVYGKGVEPHAPGIFRILDIY